jgi:protocatechuate 3,4-dioxygenase alpha subunit
MALPPTPSQTIGPFFHFALLGEDRSELVAQDHPSAIRIGGTLYDGAGEVVPDAMLEIWQADADGRVPRTGGSLRRDGWTFTGWGRAATDATGHYTFTTVLPGPTEAGRLPFFAIVVLARGLTHRLFTRAYPPADASGIAADPFLAGLDARRRETLFATPDAHGLVFDVRLQGENETVFLTFPGHGES